MKKITICLLLSIALQGFAQSKLQKAHQYFIENNLDSAKVLFQESCTVPEYKAEAYLMLSIIASIYEADDDAIDAFERFTKYEQNINPYFSSFFHKEIIGYGTKKQSEKMLDFLLSLLDSGKLNGTNTSCVNEVLGFHYLHSNKLDESKKYFSKIGSIDPWQIVGSFENASGGGFDKNHGPLDNPEPDAEFYNKYHAKIKWFEMIESYPGRWKYLNYHFIIKNSVIYSQTFCTSPSDQVVEIRIGTSGSLKAWVNDNLVMEEPLERNNGLDTYIFKAKLHAGNNRILLQTGSSEISSNNFLIRITDEAGNNIDGLEFSSNYSPYSIDTTKTNPKVTPCHAEQYLIKKINTEPEDYIHSILLADQYLSKDKNYMAQRVLFDLQEKYPTFSYLNYLLIESYLRDENRTELSKSLEALKKTEPDNPFAIRLFLNEALRKQDYAEANLLINKLITKTGQSQSTYHNKIIIALARENYEEVYNLVNTAYRKYPDDATIVEYKYLIEKNTSISPSSAEKILKNYLKKNYNTEIIIELAGHLFDAGSQKAAYKTLKKLIEYEPEVYGRYFMLAEVYFNNRDYDEARKYYEKLIEFSPYTGICHYYIGKCYLETGNKPAAQREYIKAIKYNPINYVIRDELRELQGKKPVFELFEQVDLEEVCKMDLDDSLVAGSNSVILHDETQIILHEGGGQQQQELLAVKINNTEGIDIWKEYKIAVDINEKLTIDQAKVIKADGSKINAEINNNFIVFTGLESGDAIALSYKLDVYLTGKFAKQFTDVFQLNIYVPKLTKKYSILASKDLEIDYLTTNSEVKPTKGAVEDFVKYTWKETNLGSLKSEPYMPNEIDCTPMVHISTLPSWDYIAKWFTDITKNKLKSDAILQHKVDELFDGKEEMTQMEKVEAIYYYITHEIRYSSLPFRQNYYTPKRASEVISSRIGDCKDVSTLFIAMCREVGIEAKYVLVSTRNFGKNISPLPSIIFNHCMAVAFIDGKEYYVELTSEEYPFACIDQNTRFSFAMIPDEDKAVNCTPFYLDPTTRVMNKVTRNTTVDFENEKIIVNCESRKTGLLASRFRETYAKETPEECNKILHSTISREKNSVELFSFETGISNQLNENEINYQYEYSADADITKISGLEIFNIPLVEKHLTTSVLAQETRQYPLEIYSSLLSTDYEYEKVIINIPDGKIIAEIPETVDVTNNFGSYSLAFHESDGKLIIERSLTFTKERITPEEYVEFKKFHNLIVKNDTQQLAFK